LGLNLSPASAPSPVVGLNGLPARSAPKLGVNDVAYVMNGDSPKSKR
jgi:hypothetical protein